MRKDSMGLPRVLRGAFAVLLSWQLTWSGIPVAALAETEETLAAGEPTSLAVTPDEAGAIELGEEDEDFTPDEEASLAEEEAAAKDDGPNSLADETQDQATDTTDASGIDVADDEPALEVVTNEEEVVQEDDTALQAQDADESHAYGGNAPIPGSPQAPSIHDENEEVDLVAQASIPAAYSSVKKGYVTPVKDQGGTSMCWAFATTSAMESSILRRGSSKGLSYTKSTLDLSERQLGYFAYNRITDPVGYTKGDLAVCDRDYASAGGWSWLSAHTAIAGYGMVPESKAPFEDIALSNDPGSFTLADSLAFGGAVARTTDFIMVSLDDRADIKKVVMDYGAVEAYLVYSWMYFNHQTNGYYTPSANPTGGFGHAISIVGWDDDKAKEDFRNETFGDVPQGDGAWLCKNSWGPYYADDGYFWVSYYDESLPSNSDGMVFAYDLAPTSAYDYLYQHDGGVMPYFATVASGGSIANVYTTKGNATGEELRSVGFELYDANVNYTVSVYSGCTSSNPMAGTKVASQSGSTTYAGYYSIDLAKPVKMAKGTTFSVMVTLSKKNGSDIRYGVDGSYTATGFDGAITNFVSAVSKGQSFVKKKSGAAWSDLAIAGGNKVVFGEPYSDATCARIKAYTVKASVPAKKNIKDATISVADQAYTGKARTPQPTVKYAGKTLKKGTDYTLSYSNNVKVGKNAKVTITGKGNYTGKVTKTFRIAFKDVPKSHPFYGKIHRAADLGVISGYQGSKYGSFGPADNITRGQIAVMLWNVAGQPKPSAGAKVFPDASNPKAYYYNAVRWAASVGVVSGYKTGKFGPDDNITREQLAVMIANYASKIGKAKVSGSASDIAKLPDAKKVSGYAVNSVAWCYKKKLLVLQSGKINAGTKANRATAAQMAVDLRDLLR